jgi:hypothetical protein
LHSKSSLAVIPARQMPPDFLRLLGDRENRPCFCS